MKKNHFIIVIICLVSIFGCMKTKNELLQGVWRFRSSVNLKTNRLIRDARNDTPLFAVVSENSITLTDGSTKKSKEVYSWKIVDDSLYIIGAGKKYTFPFFIETLNEKRLSVHAVFFGKMRVNFEKQ